MSPSRFSTAPALAASAPRARALTDTHTGTRRKRRTSPTCETLETRQLLTANTAASTVAQAFLQAVPMAAGGYATYTPQQIDSAYGISSISFPGGSGQSAVKGTGAGQTIAIVDAYHYPTAAADLHEFSMAFGLPDVPSLRVVAQDGSTNFPPVDPSGPAGLTGQSTWSLEAALDLQWAHAIAPGANLILVEANDASFSNLVQAAVTWA